MTRETKIGLLVGLAFIIVVGILLSEYNRMESPASLSSVASDVRAGANTPHNDSTQNEVVPPPAASTPQQTVPTRDELAGDARIRVNPNAIVKPRAIEPRQPMPPIRDSTVADDSNLTAPQGDITGPSITNTPSIPETQVIDPAPAHPTRDGQAGGLTPPPAGPVVPAAQTGPKKYVAQSGDTVSKLAGRFLGVNNKANRQAIIALNPSLKANPNNITVGKTYLIPQKGTASAAAPARVVADDTKPAPAAPTSTAHTRWYTVKDDDNLWRIAKSQLGDPNDWTEIRDLNRDVLKGSDTVRTNMRLKLPLKTVATAE